MADPQPTELVTPPVPKPTGLWGMVLTATPVALTALATAFAGLSSSEMTQAMYHRSLAAQHQSRAGDQWAFFQAKRIRGNGLESSGELLQALGHPDPFGFSAAAATLGRMETLLDQVRDGPGGAGDRTKAATAAVKKAHETMNRLHGATEVQSIKHPNDLAIPFVEPTPLPDPQARQAYDEIVGAIRKRQTEAETASLVVKLAPETVDEAIRLAEDDADRFDKACEPVNETVKELKATFTTLAFALRPLRPLPGGAGGPAGEAGRRPMCHRCSTASTPVSGRRRWTTRPGGTGRRRRSTGGRPRPTRCGSGAAGSSRTGTGSGASSSSTACCWPRSG